MRDIVSARQNRFLSQKRFQRTGNVLDATDRTKSRFKGRLQAETGTWPQTIRVRPASVEQQAAIHEDLNGRIDISSGGRSESGRDGAICGEEILGIQEIEYCDDLKDALLNESEIGGCVDSGDNAQPVIAVAGAG